MPLQGFNFVSEPVRSLDETKFDVRVDHNFSANDTVFARFSYDDAVSYVPGGFTGGFAEASAFGSNQGIINHARNVAIGETHVFSPTTVNQASFGYNRIFDYITSQGTGSLPISPSSTSPARTSAAPARPGARTCTRELIAAAWFQCCSTAATGPSATAATLRSRAEPISLRSPILST